MLKSSGNAMHRVSITLALWAVLVASACAPSVQVRTQVAPNADLSGRESFRILPVPQRRVDAASAYSDDPMLANSITNRALVDDLTRAFESRGYLPNAQTPDFNVAYYTSAREKLDITSWDYGYTWRRWPRSYAEVTEYTQGTVIVDVIDPVTHELLWRGRGVARVSNDPHTYTKELNGTVTAILKTFPQAAPLSSASR